MAVSARACNLQAHQDPMPKNTEDTAKLLAIVEAGSDNDAYLAADRLAEIGSEEIMQKLMELLSSPNHDTVYLAARALSKCKENAVVLDNVFELLKNGQQPFLKGILTEALSGFNCSEHFVEIFKLYLFGNLKTSAMSKEILDEQDFAITPRVIRKAEKHWKHYQHNVKQDDDFHSKKEEVEHMFSVMKELFEGEETDEEQGED
jgi:hypothetical protein